MPTLRRINKMQLKIQRTGTLQSLILRGREVFWGGVFFFFFCFPGCFLKRTDTRNKGYLRFHIAITVTGGPLLRGINALVLGFLPKKTAKVGIYGGRRGLPASFMSRGGFQGLSLIVVSTEIQVFRTESSVLREI